MSLTIRTAVLACLLAACPAALAEVVLLGTGALLEGRVERRPDQIILHGPGSEVLLRANEVLCVVDSPLEAYEWLRRERVADAEGHLALASWAIENQLWPQAARELLDARQSNPHDRRLVGLERRLDELSRPRPEAPPKPESPVVTASAAEPIAPEPLPELPPGSLEHFTRKIQPLLRNGCASCHRGGSDDQLGLDPHWVRGHASRRSTDHNLRATLAQIDLGAPEASRLLAAARGPHHGATPFRGPRRDELLARLEAWVYRLAAVNPQSVEPPPTGVGGSPAIPEAPHVDTAVEPATYDAPVDEYEPLDQPATPPQRGVQLKRVEPRDEFDPAIFNERFRRPEDDQ